MVLHIFNPSHDEALAANTPYYTPTQTAQQLERKYADLPGLWAMPGDEVLLPDTHHVNWEEVERIEPWGWDAPLKLRLRRLGAPERLLPSDEQLRCLRQLSSRQTAVRLLPLLRTDVPETFGESCFCHSELEVEYALAAYGTAMLKSPWSCSGRGVFRSTKDSYGTVRQRVRRILNAQGGIEVEPYYPAGRDFAMEFSYSENALFYEGISLFHTSPDGKYQGNRIGAEDELLCELGIDITLYTAVQQSIIRRLPTLLGRGYSGPVGVDMMWSNEHVHPCIEINLRQTMGRVALRYYKKLLTLQETTNHITFLTL